MAAAGQRPKRRAKKPDGFGAEAFSEAEWPLHQFDAGTVRLTWSQRPAGALAVMQSVIHRHRPALLDLASWWRQTPLALVLAAQAAVVVVYAVLMVREGRRALRPEPTAHTGPLPVTASA